MEENFYVFTFYSTHLALDFEKNLEDKFKIKLIPVPRQISSSCGLAGKIRKEDLKEIKEYCNNHNLEYDNVYEISPNQEPKKIC